jgi:hypothetical protein
VRRAATNVVDAGWNVLAASRAGVAAARDAVGEAGERAGAIAGEAAEAADSARERAGDVAIEAGRAAVGIGVQLLHLPELVREGARRGREAMETSGARAVVSAIETGTRVLSAAAEYVSELAPRRRVREPGLQALLVEQLRWAHAGTEAYDQAVETTEDVETRTQLVRFKLQTIRQVETLSELLCALGVRIPAEEREPSPPTAEHDGARRGLGAARQAIALAFTIAAQSAEGWRALARVAAWAEPERTAEAIACASEAVGSDPEEQVEFLRQALLDRTLWMVLA